MKQTHHFRTALLLTISIICASHCTAQDSTYRVAFWNVENFFDIQNDTLTTDDDFTPAGSYHWTLQRFATKKDHLYKTIVAMGQPLLMGMAEVENDYVMRELCMGTPLRKHHYNYVHYDSPDRRGIDCALIYREDRMRVLESKPIVVSDSRESFYTRDILMVEGLVDDHDTLFVLVNHWPSRRGGAEADIHRERIARQVWAMQDSLILHHPTSKVVVMGDFNSDMAAGEGEGSYKYQGTWQWIDQIFVNGMPRAKAFNADFLLVDDQKYLGKKPFRSYIGPRYQGGYSDHLPVFCDL